MTRPCPHVAYILERGDIYICIYLFICSLGISSGMYNRPFKFNMSQTRALPPQSWHMVFPLHGMIFYQISTQFTILTRFKYQPQSQFFNETSLNICSKMNTTYALILYYPSSYSPLFFSVGLITM